MNNEEISFNIKGFIEIPHPAYIHKIVADFGDGTTLVLNKPMNSEDDSWMRFSHRFIFGENVQSGKVVINVYNIYGESGKKELNFTVKLQTLAEQNIEFRLVSANLCNDKKISYVFNNIDKNQLILAKNR